MCRADRAGPARDAVLPSLANAISLDDQVVWPETSSVTVEVRGPKSWFDWLDFLILLLRVCCSKRQRASPRMQ